MNLYVLKNKDGAFVHESPESSKELLYVTCDPVIAQQYTASSVMILSERFKGTWREQEIKPYRVSISIEEISLEDLQ